MITPPQIPDTFPATQTSPLQGGITFREAAPMLATVVDNGVCPDDPRVKTRANEAIKMVLDNMIPVGGMCTANVAAVDRALILPPEMENVYEAVPTDASSKVWGDPDIKQGWYDIVSNSVYLDPSQQHDNPLIDMGLWPDSPPDVLRRIMFYPGLEPADSIVRVTGARRYIPITKDDDYLIVQNIEALKLLVLSIERNENSSPDEAIKYRQQAFDLLQAEVKKHILDPRNYMWRKAAYEQDMMTYAQYTMGWLRASLALDIDDALRVGKHDLSWSINQAERRIMQRALYKDTIVQITANVVGGFLYFPVDVQTVLALAICGSPIPIRSIFFQYLENGPGWCPCNSMLIDQGDEVISGSTRRKYKLVACVNEGTPINAVCKLRWRYKRASDMMVIKNYEAMRLMMTAKFLEAKENWQESQANQQQAFEILDKETRDYLSGIKHTPQIQTYGFGLGDVGGYYTL